MKAFKSLLPLLFAAAFAASPVLAQDPTAYTDKVGERVAIFENNALNYRLDLTDEAYTFVDFSEQAPDASFAAIRFKPNAFSLLIVEHLNSDMTAEQYAELVQISMSERLSDEENSEYIGHKDLGIVEERGLQFFQKVVYAKIADLPMTYVMSTIVDGARSYQLLTFAARETEQAIKMEADKMMAGFSIIDPAANVDVVSSSKSIRDYRSATFGYRFRAQRGGWYEWPDLEGAADGADVGALSAHGFGTAVMPVCWLGNRPTDNAIFSVMMQQFGEDYPSDFITEEIPVSKGDATGKLLIGTEEVEGEDYLYYQWIVANDRCAYTLAGWGPADRRDVRSKLNKLWSDFDVSGEPTAIVGQYENDRELGVNATLLNFLGMHFYEARSFRDAHNFFAHASTLVPTDEAYLLNAVRALAEVDAHREAYDFLLPRQAPFRESQELRSWSAWLAYQTGDPETATGIYRELFAADYREDDDFSAYLTILADAGEWQELDAAYAAYTAGGVNDTTRLLQVRLLSRREKYAEALQLLDEMTAGRPFNADLVYQRISVLDNMKNPTEVLRLAESLIESGYKSLRSYYHKGDAEYQLRSYRTARESFETALTFAPGNTNIREYIAAIDLMLGQGDVSTISVPIDPVALPQDMQEIFAANDEGSGEPGYGADFLSRITGYEFSGGDTRTETFYRKIRVTDDNGVSQFSTLEFDYDPSYETLFVNSLLVRDATGELLGEGDLSSYYITNDEDGYEASTDKTVHLPVPGLAPGAVIEVVVSKQTSVEDGSFPLETSYLASDRPIAYSALFVTGQYDQIRYQSYGVPQPIKRSEALVWELQSPVAFRWEPLQPYVDQILPWVQLGTVGSNWQSVGSEYLAKIEDKLDVEAVSERASRLVEGVNSESRRIEILSAYVQDEIRYEAIEFGRRAYIPKTARKTLRDRYGDCKDHALLLYSLLKSVGIDASLALVNLQQMVIPDLPNTDQFNHMIVSVPAGEVRVFIDTTDKDMRLGQLAPRSMAGNHALLLGDEPELVLIPEYQSALTGLDIERIVEPGDDGYMIVRETAQLRGYQAAEMRSQLRSIETSEMQTALQRWVANRYSDAELTDYVVENVFDAGYDLILEIQYTLPLEPDGSFNVPSFLEAHYLEYDRVAERRFPFEFSYPLRVSATTTVKLPSNRRLDTVTHKPGVGESRFGNWRREVSEADGSWEMRFDYVASEARFTPEDYREFAEFQRKAVDAIEQPLVIQ